MPETRRVSGKIREVMAAAQLYSVKNFGRDKRTAARVDSTWQETAWGYWDDTPEVRFAGTWIGNSMGRARLFAGRRTDDGSIEALPPEHEASRLVKMIAGGATGQSQMLTEFGAHLVVAGEAWIIIVPTPTSEKWHVVSVLEAKERSGSLEVEIEGVPVRVPMHDENEPLADNDLSPLGIRVWQPHPRRHIEADSPIRSSFTLLDELRLLNAAVAAITKSRLTGRGLVFIPQGTKFPTAPGNAGAEDDLLETLLNVAEIAYTEPDSAAAAVPIFLEVPAEFIGTIQKMTFESNFDEIAIKLREECIRRFASGLDTPAEVLLGMSQGNHWCRTATTTVLSERGWLRHDDVHVGDRVMSLNHETGVADWSDVLDVYEASVIDQPMMIVDVSRSHGGPHWSITQTPEHRNPVIRDGVRMMVTGRELQRDDRLTIGAPAVELPSEATYTDDLVRLLAWYSADGTVTGTDERPGQIRIGKSWRQNPDKVARLVAALTGVFGPATKSMPIGSDPMWRCEHHHGSGMMIAVLNAAARDVVLGLVPGKDKIIDPELVRKFTAAQLEMFIDTWLDSDGGRRGTADPGSGRVRQRVAARLDALELTAVLSGRAIRRWEVYGPTGFTPDGVMHNLAIGGERSVVVMSVAEATYTGVIWCPVTATGTWLARDGESWTDYTGNSAWAIEESAIRVAIEPKLSTVCDALTTQWLQPALTEDDPDIVVWYDTSDLRVRLNRSETSIQLYDRGEITGDALRRETQFDDADKPNEQQKREAIITGIIKAAPSLAPTLLPLIGIDLPPIVPLPGQDVVVVEPLPDVDIPVDEEASPPADIPPPGDIIGGNGNGSGLHDAADGLIWRALERAGQRIRSRQPRAQRPELQDVSAAAIHVTVPIAAEEIDSIGLLDDAWDRVPEVAARYGVDPDCLTASLDEYCRDLIAAGVGHQFAAMPAVLNSPCLAATDEVAVA